MQSKPILKRKKSLFTSIMAKKEAKIAERIMVQNLKYEAAKEKTADANARLAAAKSSFPLMIVERRIPKLEILERKNLKLQEVKARLESYSIYNRKANEYIEEWRTKEGLFSACFFDNYKIKLRPKLTGVRASPLHMALSNLGLTKGWIQPWLISAWVRTFICVENQEENWCITCRKCHLFK